MAPLSLGATRTPLFDGNLAGFGIGRPCVIDSLGPVHGGERSSQQTLAIGPVEHEEVAVARCLHQQLAWLPVEIGIHQHGNFVRIPIVRIVRRDLEAPDQFPGVRVQRDDAAGPGIIARPRSPFSTGVGFAVPS